jgi:hypothetical protein
MTDLCEITEGSTVAKFESTTGKYSLSTEDVTGVPQGSYQFEIVAEVGSKKFTSTYTVEFKNPCTEFPIQLVEPTPFEDYTHYLGD